MSVYGVLLESESLSGGILPPGDSNITLIRYLIRYGGSKPCMQLRYYKPVVTVVDYCVKNLA